MNLGKTKLPSRVSKAIQLFERAVREHAEAQLLPTCEICGYRQDRHEGETHVLEYDTEKTAERLRESSKNLRVILHQDVYGHRLSGDVSQSGSSSHQLADSAKTRDTTRNSHLPAKFAFSAGSPSREVVEQAQQVFQQRNPDIPTYVDLAPGGEFWRLWYEVIPTRRPQ